MPVAVQLDFEAATLDQYDEILAKMGLEPQGKGPAGMPFPRQSQAGKGLHITDLWETREQFDKWAQEKIGPLSAEAGITNQPAITFHDVHNYLTKGWLTPLPSQVRYLAGSASNCR